MSLLIAQLDTICHVAEQHRAKAEVVDRVARNRLARDLGDHLGPSLSRQPAIVRIRHLSLRVIIPAAEFTEDAVSLAWRQAFGKALFTALAYPAGTGPVEVFRAESIAVFIASAICDLINGTAATQWQYAEFEEFFRRGSTQAALGLLCEWPAHTIAILLELARRGVLRRLLARFDDVALERLFSVLAPPADSQATPRITDLISAARLTLANPPERTLALRSRAYALSLFIDADRMGQPMESPRVLFHSLLALAVLLNPSVFWPDVPTGSEHFSVERLAARLPSNVMAFLERLIKVIRQQSPDLPGSLQQPNGQPQPSGERDAAVLPSELAELNAVVAILGAQLKVPAPSPVSPDIRWIPTEWCGLFFLCGTLARLGWIRAWQQLPAFQPGGVACLIAGVALAIAEKFDPAVPVLDAGIALFAGYLAEPDLIHLRRVFQHFSREVRLSVLEAAIPQDGGRDAAESWASTFNHLAAFLLREFGSRIRGFRQADRQNIVRSFIARPGRIRMERERIVVFPNPNPFHVAVHISGLDEPVEPGIWIGGLRMEFDLGAL